MDQGIRHLDTAPAGEPDPDGEVDVLRKSEEALVEAALGVKRVRAVKRCGRTRCEHLSFRRQER